MTWAGRTFFGVRQRDPIHSPIQASHNTFLCLGEEFFLDATALPSISECLPKVCRRWSLHVSYLRLPKRRSVQKTGWDTSIFTRIWRLTDVTVLSAKNQDWRTFLQATFGKFFLPSCYLLQTSLSMGVVHDLSAITPRDLEYYYHRVVSIDESLFELCTSRLFVLYRCYIASDYEIMFRSLSIDFGV